MSKTILLFAVALMLVLPSAALAQVPGNEGYRGNDGTVQGIVESNNGGGGNGAEGAGTNPSASQQSTGSGSDSGSKGGSLPFTGADLGVLALAGAMLVLMGFGLRRMTHRTSEV